MKTPLLIAALCAVVGPIAIGCASAHAQDRAKPAEGREIELLVYSSDFGLVQDTRTVELKEGTNRIGFTEVSKSLDQNSVIFSWPGGSGTEVQSSTYDLGMNESGTLLKRFLGKEVELVYRGDNGREGERIKGILEVADPGNVVVQANGRYIVNPDATIEAPADQGIVTIPQLTAEVKSDKATNSKVAMSYLSRGLSWSADYTLTLSPNGSNLECWASVLNQTGTDYPEAKIKFVAGSPNVAANDQTLSFVSHGRGDLFEKDASGFAAGKTKARRVPFNSIGELYAYPYEAKATVRQDQINRVKMMSEQSFKLKKWYSIRIPTLWRDGYSGNPDQRLKGMLGINFKNDEASGLGRPLPAGAVRVYEPDDQARPQYIGAATIGDTPKDARLSLTLSEAFDVYATSKLVKSEKIGKRKVRKTLQVVVHNEKKSDQEVRVVQDFYGVHTLVREAIKSVNIGSGQRQWTVQVPAGGQKTLEIVVDF